MASTATRSQRSMLLTIASEIRLAIYTFLFHDSVVHIHFDDCTSCEDGSETYCSAICPSTIDTQTYRSAITETCCQLRRESLCLLLRSTRLHICDTAASAAESHSAASAIPKALLENTTHITTEVISRLNSGLAKRCPNLQQLTISRCSYSALPVRRSDSDDELVRSFIQAVAVKEDYAFVHGLLHDTALPNLTVLCEVYFVADVFALEAIRLYALIDPSEGKVIKRRMVKERDVLRDCKACMVLDYPPRPLVSTAQSAQGL